jgi:tetratricopeptide (TPR) repeat protein
MGSHDRTSIGIVMSTSDADDRIRAALLAIEGEEARADFPKALDLVDVTIARNGAHASLLLKRAQLLLNLRRRREALDVAGRAAEVAGTDPRLHLSAALIYHQMNLPGHALPLLYRALERAPNDPTLLYLAGLSHHYLNESAQAGPLLERVLAIAPGNGYAVHLRSQLRTWTREDNHVAELRAALARPRLRDLDAIQTSFALAKELEDMGDHGPSFEVLLQANRIKRRTLNYDVKNDVQAMQSVMSHYSREAMDRISGGDATPGPIFIVGMPRTGTTLVERILSSHTRVTSVGEAVDFPLEMAASARKAHARSGSTDFAELGRKYRAAVGQLSEPRAHAIDKQPSNFRYCGIIHKALPRATIIHLARDPMDTCYAVFKTLFVDAYHFAYQLDELAEYYIGYRRMMDHWHAVMPGVIVDVNYEELVSDPETQCRRLLERCGLEWQDEVLDFHRSVRASTTASAAQVRQPIYRSSVQKWRNHARQLQPVLLRLAEAGLVDGEGNPVR